MRGKCFTKLAAVASEVCLYVLVLRLEARSAGFTRCVGAWSRNLVDGLSSFQAEADIAKSHRSGFAGGTCGKGVACFRVPAWSLGSLLERRLCT